jgi:hypothetical protein
VLRILAAALPAALALGALFAVARRLGARLPEPKGTIRFELARTVSDVRRHLESPDRYDNEVKSLRLDWGFIVVYTGVFAGLGVVLGRRDEQWAPELAGIAIAFAVFAALLDVVENLNLKRTLDRWPADVEHEAVWTARKAARAKFAALAVVAAALSALLWTSDGGWYERAAGALFSAAALVGWFAVASERWLPLFFGSLVVCGVAVAILGAAEALT